MNKPPKKPQVFRVCAICGKRHGVTYGFRNILRLNGIEGDKATRECIMTLRNVPVRRSDP